MNPGGGGERTDGWTEQISIRNQRKACRGIDAAAVFIELLTGFTNTSVKSRAGF